ncbi:MAG: aldo/keto reductase, partial [Gammaproteobacteria bacterium]
MLYRRLGSSDLEVSELGLGSWLTYGVTVERDRAGDCIRRAFELGINFFDTANMYGRGAAESLLGELLSPYKRDSYVLATKVYFPMSDSDRGLSREQIHKQIDASLARLGVDYVDLYQCHRYDHDTPLEETMDAMSEVVTAGKARYIGFSQWTPKQIRAAKGLKSSSQFVSSQPQYSMLHRKAERRVFPLCRELGIGQIVFSPLAQGVLTGKYFPDAPPPEESRAANKKTRRSSRRFKDQGVLEAVQKLRPIAEGLSLSMSQLALAWVLN